MNETNPLSDRQAAIANMLNVRWYAAVDDLVGGWCVSNVDKRASEQDFRTGDIYIADALNEDIAQHIIELHNATLGEEEV